MPLFSQTTRFSKSQAFSQYWAGAGEHGLFPLVQFSSSGGGINSVWLVNTFGWGWDVRKNRREGEQRGRKNYNIEAEGFFFFFRETIPRCKAPSCNPLPISSQTLWRITIRTVLQNWIFSFDSGYSATSAVFLSLHLSYPLLRLSGSLISYLAMSRVPFCVPSSLTLSFPVVPLICNSTSTSSLPLCPLSLTVIVSPALQQITLALRDRHMVHTQTDAGYQ